MRLPNRRRRFPAVVGTTLSALLLIAFSWSTTGCSSQCDKLYDMTKKCAGKKDAPDKGEFVKECKKNKKKLQPMLDCTKHSGCSKFKKCMKKVFAKQEKAEEAKEKAELDKKLAGLLAKKDYSELSTECAVHKKDLSPKARQTCESGQLAFLATGLAKGSTAKQLSKVLTWCELNKDDMLGDKVKKACKGAPKLRYDRLYAKTMVVRDKGPYDKTFSLLYDLKSAAKPLGADTVAKAKALVADVELAKTVQSTLERVKKMQAKAKPMMPYNCKDAAAAIDKSKSAFAKTLKPRLLKGCYVELGKLVLEAMFKKSRPYCTFSAERVYKAVKKHNIKDPAIDPLMEKAKKHCEKK